MLRAISLILFLFLSRFAYGDNPSIFLIGDIEGTYTGTAFELQTSKGPVTITNAHICSNKVVLAGEPKSKNAVKLVVVRAVDTKHDLCILTPIPGMTTLKLAEDYSTKEAVVVEGFPLGKHFISYGIVGNYFSTSSYMDNKVMVQYIGHVDHGNSGSPVLNKNGDVIGVIAVKSGDGKYGGMVPLEFLKDFLDRQN